MNTDMIDLGPIVPTNHHFLWFSIIGGILLIVALHVIVNGTKLSTRAAESVTSLGTFILIIGTTVLSMSLSFNEDRRYDWDVIEAMHEAGYTHVNYIYKGDDGDARLSAADKDGLLVVGDTVDLPGDNVGFLALNGDE